MRHRVSKITIIAPALLVLALFLGVCVFAFAAPDESIGAEHAPAMRSLAGTSSDLAHPLLQATMAVAAFSLTSVVQGLLQIAAPAPNPITAPNGAPLQARAPPSPSSLSS